MRSCCIKSCVMMTPFLQNRKPMRLMASKRRGGRNRLWIIFMCVESLKRKRNYKKRRTVEITLPPTVLPLLSFYDRPVKGAYTQQRLPWPHNKPSPKSRDRKSTRLNSSHANISYAVFCLKKKKEQD